MPYSVGFPGAYPAQPPVGVVALQDGRPLMSAARIDPVPGTEYAVALLKVPATVTGTGVGSLVAGIAATLVALVAGCVGTASGSPIGGGAFAIAALLAGGAAIGLGLVAVRQIQRAAGRLTGRGMAIAGISCGGAGILFAALAVFGAILIENGA